MRYFHTVLFFCYMIAGLLGQATQDWSEYIEVYNEKNVNSENTEFSPSYWLDQIVFIKTKPRQRIFDQKTKEPFFDLYVSNRNEIGSLQAAKPLSSSINSEYHEGPCDFNKEGDVVFFTRVDYEQGALKLNDKKEVALKIFKSAYQNSSWSKPEKININEKNIASAHPALSYDNSFMIFASDRPGGHGKMDLYISYRSNEKWTEPRNLGEEINTKGNDWFPYLNERGYLFYASDGKEDSKGLDVYVTEMINDNWGTALRLPAPLNTSHDDFGLIVDQNGTNGFLSSNRPGGKGKDDIYSYNSLVSIFNYYNTDYNLVKLNIKDGTTAEPITDVVIRFKHLGQSEFDVFDKDIFLMDGAGIDSTYSDPYGKAKINLKEGHTLIEINHSGKEKWQLVMSNHGTNKNIDVTLNDTTIPQQTEPKIIYIEKEVPAPVTINNVKVDVGAVIVLENIYYDYNSFTLTKGAMKELNILADLMLKNQRLKIKLTAHTDSRGDADYNQELSQKRADSAKNYLISRGIDYQNITSVGYGETQLRNHCKDGVYCTEAEHIYNRRTEVVIIDN